MKTFDQLGLNEKILQGVQELGFVVPTPIQQQAIPMLVSGSSDLVGLAQTGTGKTAAFGLPLLSLIDTTSNKPQALVLAPTRELCVQISNDLENFGKYLRNLNIVAVYGGASITNQIKKIKEGVQVVVATPGRLLDLIDRGAVRLQGIRYVVLDEADEMLNMGFKDDIDSILSNTPPDKKTWLFSATMPPEVRAISRNYMHQPEEITVGVRNATNENIEHRYYVVAGRNKYAALKRIVDFEVNIFGIIFCRTKIEAQDIAESLMKDGYNADSLHGDLTQQQRDRVMNSFRTRVLQILVATDVAARGIDVNDVTHVINYQLPDEIEYYTHRSGRTARAGKTGVSIALVTPREVEKIRQIERKINQKFVQAKVPTGEEVCTVQLKTYADKVKTSEVDVREIEKLLPQVADIFKDMDKEAVIQHFVAMEMKRFLDYYRHAPDLNERDRGDREGRSDRREAHSSQGMYGKGERYFINIGAVDGLDRGKLLGYLLDNTRFNKKDIGRIDVKGVYSFFDVENQAEENVLQAFRGATFKDRKVRVERQGTEGGGDNKPKGQRFDKGQSSPSYKGKKNYAALPPKNDKRTSHFARDMRKRS